MSDPRSAGESEGEGPSPGPSHAPIPPQLQNWRVIEIEGVALSADGETAQEGEQDLTGRPAQVELSDRTDRIDAHILLAALEREIVVVPGQTGTLTLTLLNNANQSAALEVTVDGSVSPAWFPELPLRVSLQAGGRESIVLMATPPAGADTPAGAYAFDIVARSVEQPNRCSRVSCTLSIERHTDFGLGMLQPEQVTATWWSPAARTSVAVANLSNHAASFRIQAGDSSRSCLFEFEPPGSVYGQVGAATFTLGAGARSSVGVSIVPKQRPLVSLWPTETPFRIAVDMTGMAEEHQRRVVDGRLVTRALVGPWQMTGLAALVGVVMAVLLASSAVILFGLRDTGGRAAVVPTVVAPTPPPAPAFALVLSMNEPVPTREPGLAGPAADGLVPPGALADSPAGAEPASTRTANGLPVVEAGQVSAPGEPIVLSPWSSQTDAAPVAAAAAGPRPTPIAVAPVDPSNMTYAEMFQSVASRYDLNWRMLAAQGYVESGFDSTAVGRQGSLGLMQIHPDTWQEWAPRADASDPFDTYSNALVAAIYLDYLRTMLGKQGYPQVEWMLAAYNWGPDKVLGHLDIGGEWTDLPDVVQQYATDVLRIAQSIPSN